MGHERLSPGWKSCVCWTDILRQLQKTFRFNVSIPLSKDTSKRHKFNVSVDVRRRPLMSLNERFCDVFLTFNYWCQPDLHVCRRPKRPLTRHSNIELILHVHQTYTSGSGLMDVTQTWSERLPDFTCLQKRTCQDLFLATGLSFVKTEIEDNLSKRILWQLLLLLKTFPKYNPK